MKEQNFERELPEGYGQVYHINAKDKKIGIVLNLIGCLFICKRVKNHKITN